MSNNINPNSKQQESISESRGLALMGDNDLTVLSIGISTGGEAEIKMAQSNPNRKVIATTIDSKGLEHTRNIVCEAELSNRIELKIENVKEKMPYKDNYFDFVYARLVLHYLNKDELILTLREIYRVLRPGGKLFVVVRSTDEWELKLVGVTCDEHTCMTTYPLHSTDGELTTRTATRQFFTVESIHNYLKTANFQIINSEEYLEQLYHDYKRTYPVMYLNSLIEVVAVK